VGGKGSEGWRMDGADCRVNDVSVIYGSQHWMYGVQQNWVKLYYVPDIFVIACSQFSVKTRKDHTYIVGDTIIMAPIE